MEYEDDEYYQIGGLWSSKRIEEASKSQSKLFGVVPYIDPKILTNSKNQTKLDEKRDTNNIGLIYEITQGQKETIVPDTPNNYINIYTAGCTVVN
ncbi:hypothetical protein C1645_839365 [Glomus cerebriforme]|uniref:Protein kinase domain-containing protein n=1 Tax=Glomus cerebriforme TaxID=658196 RepID=A0A397S5S2_9GLOM|nr:hypothetical protein C1645_839365 [Glomus cerebriforme]